MSLLSEQGLTTAVHSLISHLMLCVSVCLYLFMFRIRVLGCIVRRESVLVQANELVLPPTTRYCRACQQLTFLGNGWRLASNLRCSSWCHGGGAWAVVMGACMSQYIGQPSAAHLQP